MKNIKTSDLVKTLHSPCYSVFAITKDSIYSLSVNEDDIKKANKLFNSFKKQYPDRLIILSNKNGKVLKKFSAQILQ